MLATATESAMHTTAALYGWAVRDRMLISRKGNRVHIIEQKRGRIRLVDDTGKLRGSFGRPDQLGQYLEKVFYAQRESVSL